MHIPMKNSRLILIALVVGSFLFGAACEQLEYRPQAVGKEGEIIVVTDSARWAGPVGDAIREHVAPYLGTLPAPEREFTLRRVSLTTSNMIDLIRKQKNVIIAAPLGDSTRESNFLRARLDSAAVQTIMGGETRVISRADLWRQDQQVVYLLAPSDERLVDVLSERGDDLRYTFNRVTRERMTKEMFEKGRQPEIEQEMMEKHGFAVNVQHDYFTAIDTTNFVWLRRVITSESWRSVFVYYEDGFSPADLTPEWAVATRDSLTREWIQGNVGGWVNVDERRELTSENIDFLDRFAYETRGLWHMVGEDTDGSMIEYGMGGPFVNYAFYDQETGRVYMIDGMVFAPNYDKREFLRQMEVIAHTFRTRAEVAPPDDSESIQASL